MHGKVCCDTLIMTAECGNILTGVGPWCGHHGVLDPWECVCACIVYTYNTHVNDRLQCISMCDHAQPSRATFHSWDCGFRPAVLLGIHSFSAGHRWPL